MEPGAADGFDAAARLDSAHCGLGLFLVAAEETNNIPAMRLAAHEFQGQTGMAVQGEQQWAVPQSRRQQLLRRTS